MRIADIMELTGASKATIYRWMDRHPTLASGSKLSAVGESEGALPGTTFPKPERKEGRVVIWNENEVLEWWKANEDHIGRHPEESHIIELPYARYRAAMSYPVKVHEDEDGNQVVEDYMASVTKTERNGDLVRIWFADITDAVLFKIKFA